MSILPTIQLERILLRPFRPDDAEVVQELAGDTRIAEMTLNIPHPYENGMAEQWIKTHAEQFNEGRVLTLAIVHHLEKKVMGSISLGCNKTFNHGELGYWVGRKYQNKGYCTEAAEGMMKYGFEMMDLNRIFARHMGKNPASGKVMKKLGMKYEGLLRQHVKKCGDYEDLMLYGILRDEYIAGQ